jgi:hypothetical protein
MLRVEVGLTPAGARYEPLFAGRKSGSIKKVKYIDLTRLEAAGLRSTV